MSDYKNEFLSMRNGVLNIVLKFFFFFFKKAHTGQMKVKNPVLEPHFPPH